MIKTNPIALIVSLITLTFTMTVNADGFIKKEVYSFKDTSGNFVFTDQLPTKNQVFKTQTIEAANSTGQENESSKRNYDQGSTYSNNLVSQQKTIRVVVENGSAANKQSHTKKRSLKRCKSYKKKFDHYSDKMNSGYKNSEYKKLASNRKKYKRLLFDNCDTRTFSD